MQFGLQFFPDVTPQRSRPAIISATFGHRGGSRQAGLHACAYRWHYFQSYGGYSPNPIVFLSAASQRACALVTGAVLPVFNNPLKLAGEIGMLDAISGGRLDVGFARAFLPHEFRRFGISPHESVARFREAGAGRAPARRKRHRGRFHTIENTTCCRGRRSCRGRNSTSQPSPLKASSLLDAYTASWVSRWPAENARATVLSRGVPRSRPCRRGESCSPSHVLPRGRRKRAARAPFPTISSRSSIGMRLDGGSVLGGLSRLRQDHRIGRRA